MDKKDLSQNCDFDDENDKNDCWRCIYFLFPIGCIYGEDTDNSRKFKKREKPLYSLSEIAEMNGVKYKTKEVTVNKAEELISIFGRLCDYMVDNGRCDVFCPYAETKNKDDECEAWRTIQKIRQED